MKLRDLSESQKNQLREEYVDNHLGNPSYMDLAQSMRTVTDEMLEEEYGSIEFTDDDFW
jgi:hypothetical protein